MIKLCNNFNNFTKVNNKVYFINEEIKNWDNLPENEKKSKN